MVTIETGRLARQAHWSYDLNTHIALLAAHKAEKAKLVHKKNVDFLERILRRGMGR